MAVLTARVGASIGLAGEQQVPVLLSRAAATCWLLTLFTVTLDAGWRLPILGSHGGIIHLYWSDLLMAATLACWAGYLLLQADSAVSVGPLGPLAALAGLTGLALAGAPFASFPAIALGMAGRLLLLLLFYLYTLNQRVRPRWICTALLASLALQGLVAVGQALRQSSLGLSLLGERQLNLDWSGISVVAAHGGHWLRSYGLTAHPNLLGGFVAASLLPLAVGLPRRFAGPAIVGCSGLLLLTFSRGAVLATIAGLAVFVLGLRRPVRLPSSWKVYALTGLISLLVLLAFTPVAGLISARFDLSNALEGHSIDERLSTQSSALRMIADHPLHGVGANNYLPVAGEQVGGSFAEQGYVPVVHNAFLLATAELGIAGGPLLAVALLAPAWKLLRGGGALFAAALAAGLTAGAAVGMVDFYAWSSSPYRLFWIMLLGTWAATLVHTPKAAIAVAS